MHTDHLDGSLSVHRRGTLSGMDAAPEPTRTYLRRVLRWWAGKGPAANPQIVRSKNRCTHSVQSPFKATKAALSSGEGLERGYGAKPHESES
ncbi:hypothetical protein XaplCFBP3122_10700 [Xanthomonas arboricola pv. populi]|uniref:Uncharacterized protein n=1 Tax=Xanthomonas arboricola pv. populi TaxID=487823 RepID=A0A2S6Z4N5_9XANT|nr:hypothetical protein XaplCFBP3122_10700 [Xanthomonas arboricola pv. populi]